MQTHADDISTQSPICVDAVSSLAGSFEETNDETIQIQALDSDAALGQDLRNFFDQIMVPEYDFIGSQYMQPPLDLAAWMDEAEYFGELDLFGTNFLPNMDQIFEPQPGLQQNTATPKLVDAGSISSPNNDRGSVNTSQPRHIAFQNSLWYVAMLDLHSALLIR
jgi:hypothetical protein